MTSRSEFVDLVQPLRTRLRLYDATRPPTDQPKNDAADPARGVPQSFIDAMIVREAVFVQEQAVPLANELDEDDARSFHWVAYASLPSKSNPISDATSAGASSTPAASTRRKSSTSTKIPIGTIRLVPPPHAPHPNGAWGTATHDEREPYIKLGRLAVIREFRKAGIARLLIDAALGFARERSVDLLPAPDPSAREALLSQELQYGSASSSAHHHHNRPQQLASTTMSSGGPAMGASALDFRGLVLVHAQTGVQKVWRRYGFETDASMGEWDEEGIMHVGMWRRIELAAGGRRKSRIGSGMMTV